MKFTELNLHPQIIKALEMCHYKEPTPIQEKAIPVVLSGKDLVATAQTGTGKTAAFVLPMLHQLQAIKSQAKGPRALILTPTRELANQITQAISQYGRFTQPRIVSLVGGMPYHQQIRQLSRQVDIVIATPGRLMDHMDSGRLHLSNIEMLVLDEADRMLDMGFIDDVKHIAKTIPTDRQTLLFSATLDSRLTRIVKELLNQPVRIDLCEKITPTRITQELYMADNAKHKLRLLLHFLKEESVFRAIIFSATKRQTDELADELCEQGLAAGALHGDLRQNVRNRTIDQLRRGKIQFLVATDVAARGIDINDISHVFNFDLPRFSEDYVHRIGRTGRAGKKGIAISLATSMDVRHVKKIEQFMKLPLERKTISGLEPSNKKQDSFPPRHRKKSFGASSADGKRFGDKKLGDKKFGDKKFGDKKFGDKKFGDKKFGDKKFGDKKFSEGKKLGEGKSFAKKSGKPSFGGKFSKRPPQKSSHSRREGARA
ncbi:MAG: DEAD/DEAH box helicase [Gammaproteobacteria bacterium]|nr:DEAD/DEAH box helicase [Gammaproteobacteria bacterium]